MSIRTVTLLKVLFLGLLFLLLISFCPRLAHTQEPQSAGLQPAATRGLRNLAELEAFFDGIMAAQQEALHISGAAVAVAANGQVLFAKGYGYADFEKRKKVDPGSTLFRIGSVSKLFTWTAVMQLVEQGRLDLNADVNTYLGQFKVPETFPEPIALSHLLTHTPGFEDQVIGLFARTPDRLRPLGVLLADELPDRVRPAGRLAAYSNHGTALAGYIVQEVAGLPFEEYVEKNILQPLEMKHSTLRQPVPAALEPDLAVGYKYSRGDFRAQGFEYVPAFPAGSMSAPAIDMAHFMIAHLQRGIFGQSRILSEETAARMHSRLFSHAPQLSGILHGFYEMNRNGERIFGHGGDTIWFHTQLALFPEHGIGVFISYNCDTGSKARSDFMRAFINHYFPPAEAAQLKPAADFRRRAGMFTGAYASLRRSYTSLAKLAALVQTVRISVDSEDFLTISGPGQEAYRWVETEPLVFRDVKGQDTLVFRQDEDGKITHAFIGSLQALEKLAFIDDPRFQYTWMGLSALILAAACVGWPIGYWRRRGRFTPGPASRAAHIWAWSAAALLVVFLAGLAVSLIDPMQVAFGVPQAIRILLALPLVSIPFVVVALALAVLSWIRGIWSAWRRAGYSLVVAAAIALLWWLRYWNLLGYYFK